MTWTCAGSNGGSLRGCLGQRQPRYHSDPAFQRRRHLYHHRHGRSGHPARHRNQQQRLTVGTGRHHRLQPGRRHGNGHHDRQQRYNRFHGTVYNDSGTGGGIAHNGIADGSEAGVNAGLTYYAKIFRSADLGTTVATPVQVNATTGAYSFSGIPAYGSYTVILSSTATANLYDPSFPSANWISVSPANLALPNVPANGANLSGQDFFLYNGSRITGKVIRDDGFNGSVSNAYDGILNGAEAGLAGVTVTLPMMPIFPRSPMTPLSRDANGNFTLYTNMASATLRIYETNPAGYISVSFNPGTTAGTYAIGGDYLRFAYTLYTDYSGVIFGEITQPPSHFTPAAQSAGGIPRRPGLPRPYLHLHGAPELCLLPPAAAPRPAGRLSPMCATATATAASMQVNRTSPRQ